MVLRTVTEMQKDVGMTSQTGYFRFISLFGNHLTKIHNKVDDNTSLQKKKKIPKHHKNNCFSCLVLSVPITMATVYKFHICY